MFFRHLWSKFQLCFCLLLGNTLYLKMDGLKSREGSSESFRSFSVNNFKCNALIVNGEKKKEMKESFHWIHLNL